MRRIFEYHLPPYKKYFFLRPFITILEKMYHSRYLYFFLAGASGVAINLSIAWLFTEFILGKQNYFYGYLIGLIANLIYNFILNTEITFKTRKKHIRRFTLYTAYNLSMSAIQAYVVKTITPILGIQYYLIIIAGVILTFSIATFFIFKYWLFNEK